MSAKSISQCKGKGSIGHNNREFYTENIDRNRTPDNVVFMNQPIGEAYKELFDGAVERYNNRQIRNDRKVGDYYESLFNRSPCNSVLESADKRKSFYEDLVQVGTKDDCGCGTPNGNIAAKCLTEYMEGYRQRNLNFHVFNAVLHLDEATPHLHINYIPIGHYKRGLDTQNGYNQALKEMGFTGADCFHQWRERERAVLRGICAAHGLEIKPPEEEKGRGHSFTVEEYKEEKDRARAELKALEEKIEELTPLLNQLQAQYDDIALRHAQIAQIRTKEEETLKHLSEKKAALMSKIVDIRANLKEKNIEFEVVAQELKKIIDKKAKASEIRRNPFTDRETQSYHINMLDSTRAIGHEVYKDVQKAKRLLQEAKAKEIKIAEKEKEIKPLHEKALADSEKASKLVKNQEVYITQQAQKIAEKRFSEAFNSVSDKRTQRLEKYCEEISFKDGSTVLDRFREHEKALEKQIRDDYNRGMSR